MSSHSDHSDHSDNSGNRSYFDDSTVALGTMYTIALIAIITSILIWG
jgi:hypothetical protein